LLILFSHSRVECRNCRHVSPAAIQLEESYIAMMDGLMMCPFGGVWSTLTPAMAVCHRNLPFKPISAPPPSLRHALPLGFARRIANNFGHIFTLGGVLQKFVRGILWHIFRFINCLIMAPAPTRQLYGGGAFTRTYRCRGVGRLNTSMVAPGDNATHRVLTFSCLAGSCSTALGCWELSVGSRRKFQN
jgi:hypothetical protein